MLRVCLKPRFKVESDEDLIIETYLIIEINKTTEYDNIFFYALHTYQVAKKSRQI